MAVLRGLMSRGMKQGPLLIPMLLNVFRANLSQKLDLLLCHQSIAKLVPVKLGQSFESFLLSARLSTILMLGEDNELAYS